MFHTAIYDFLNISLLSHYHFVTGDSSKLPLNLLRELVVCVAFLSSRLAWLALLGVLNRCNLLPADINEPPAQFSDGFETKIRLLLVSHDKRRITDLHANSRHSEGHLVWSGA